MVNLEENKRLIRSGHLFPHTCYLSRSDEDTLLYKVISIKDFINSINNDYLYFKRVDTYKDDRFDSSQTINDRNIHENIHFQRNTEVTLDYYHNSSRERTYACCFTTQHTSHIWNHYGRDATKAICIVFNYSKLISYFNSNFDKLRVSYNGKNIKTVLKKRERMIS